MKKAKIYSIANQKGGVSKTSTALNLGYALSQTGAKVLLVDLDPQASLSVCFGLENLEKDKNTIVKLFEKSLNDSILPDDVNACIHKHSKNPNIDILPGYITLALIEDRLRSEVGSERTLSEMLLSVEEKYDYIIIDTSPSLGLLLLNALSASDGVIITVSPQFLSALGLSELIKTIKKIQRRVNGGLDILGILLTMCDSRTKLYKEIKAALEESYSASLPFFETFIPLSTKVGEANLNRKSVIEYCPNNRASQAYKELSAEIINLSGRCE
ncbi:MAG: ParA family protein [Eubacterium sp.]|jgi:chromosome partitioning protein|nr:ParA family protein [Eubacterium sp.]